jgi:toxin ParE1/3/4
MPMPVQKTTQAKADLIEIADYIAVDNPEAAERFLDAAEAAFAQLAALPSIGQAVPFSSALAQGIRVWRVEGFERYLIFYRPVGLGIEVVRVLHTARDFPSISWVRFLEACFGFCSICKTTGQ